MSKKSNGVKLLLLLHCLYFLLCQVVRNIIEFTRNQNFIQIKYPNVFKIVHISEGKMILFSDPSCIALSSSLLLVKAVHPGQGLIIDLPSKVLFKERFHLKRILRQKAWESKLVKLNKSYWFIELQCLPKLRLDIIDVDDDLESTMNCEVLPLVNAKPLWFYLIHLHQSLVLNPLDKS